MESNMINLENVTKVLLSREFDPEYSILGFHDINGDGLSEMVVKTKYSIKTYSPSKNKLLWSFEPIKGEISSAILRDIDKDKRDEVLVLSKTENQYILYIISSNGTVLTEINVGRDNINLSSIRTVKVKGVNSIFVPKKRGITIFGFNGDIIWNFLASDSGYIYYRLNDFDGDNEQELLLGYMIGSNIVLEMIELDSIITRWSVSFPTMQNEKPYIEERPLTNSVALFVYIKDRLIVLDSKTGETLLERRIKNVDVFTGTADINGDGKKELIICNVDERNYSSLLEIFYVSAKQSIVYTFDGAVIDCRIGDYNGDKKEEICAIGFNDVVFFSEYGNVWRLENLFETAIYNVVEDDFDNDGINEIMVIGEVGAAILDLKEEEILWMDNNVIINEVEELFGVGDVLPIDLDEDGVDEILIVDEPNKRIIALKGESGRIRELWTLVLKGDELRDLEVLYPNPIIIILIDDRLLAVNSNGEILWEKKNFPTTFLMFGELNGDGKAEVITYDDKVGLFAIESDTGRVLWSYKGRLKQMRISDIDGDGKQEVVVIKGDTLSILNGETGSQLALKIMEGKITRVDTTDIDSDGADEIILSMGSTMTIIKDFSQIWEKHFIDPRAIKGVSTCRFYESNRLDICAYTQNSVYVFDGLTGELKDIQFFNKITGKPIIMDIDNDGLDEILVWNKEKKKLHILGKDEYKIVNVPHRKGSLKPIKLKKAPMLLYMVDKHSLYMFDPVNGVFNNIFTSDRNEKIVDIKAQENYLYLLTVEMVHGLLPVMRVYRTTAFKFGFNRIYEGLLVWGKINEANLISESEEIIPDLLAKAKFIQNPDSLSLVGMGRNKVYLYSKTLKALIIHTPEKLLEELVKVDKYIVDSFTLSERSSQIIAVKDNTLYLIDMNSDKQLEIESGIGRIVHVVSGDFDGDEKKEVILVSSGNRLYFFDPLLSIYGCEQIYDIGSLQFPLLVSSDDINIDGKDELIALLNRGLYVYGMDLFEKPAIYDMEEYEKHLDKKIKLELIRLKIKRLCDSGIIDRDLVKKIFGEKDLKKALVWKSSSKKKEYRDTDTEGN